MRATGTIAPIVREEYLYDADGGLAHVLNGKSRTLVHDGEELIAAIDDQGLPIWESVPGAFTNQVLEYQRENLERMIPVTDHRHSIVGWWNATLRQMDTTIEYTPLGRLQIFSADGSVICTEEGIGADCARIVPRFGFGSAYHTEFTGLVYMRNRWYSPKLGQFLTQDPLGYVDGYNPWAYAVFDPINFWDPFGLEGRSFADIFDVRTGRNRDDLPSNVPVGPSSNSMIRDLQALQCQTGGSMECRLSSRQTITKTDRTIETSGVVTSLKEIVELSDEQRAEGLRDERRSDRRSAPSAPELLRMLERDQSIRAEDLWARFHTHPGPNAPGRTDVRDAVRANLISVVVTSQDVYIIVPTAESTNYTARVSVGEFFEALDHAASIASFGDDPVAHQREQSSATSSRK